MEKLELLPQYLNIAIVQGRTFGELAGAYLNKTISIKEHKKWKKKLMDSGFDDLEDTRGNLKSPDSRTIAFQNQEQIREFFLTLDCFMTHFPEMPKFAYKVMSMYSEGIMVKDIVKASRSSDKHVRNTIKHYKLIVLAIIRMMNHTDFPLSLRLLSKTASEVTADADDQVKNKAA